MLRILSKLRRKPDRTYSVKAIYHVDTAEMDAALAKAEELNSAIKLYYPAFSAPDIARYLVVCILSHTIYRKQQP